MRKPPPPDPPDGLTAVSPGTWTPAWARVMATPAVKCTGYALLTWAGWKDGAHIRPGIPRLMKATGIRSDATVRNALRQMREWGLVWRYYEAAQSGLKDDADEYRLTFPGDISAIPMYSPDWEEPLCGAGGAARTTGAHYRWSDGHGRLTTGSHYRWSGLSTGTHYRWLVDPTSYRPPTGVGLQPDRSSTPTQTQRWSRPSNLRGSARAGPGTEKRNGGSDGNSRHGRLPPLPPARPLESGLPVRNSRRDEIRARMADCAFRAALHRRRAGPR